MPERIEIEQDCEYDPDMDELGSPMLTCWAPGHGHDPDEFVRAVIEHSPPDAPDIIAALDQMPARQAADIVEQGITSAVAAGDFEAVPGLLVTMCRYDPHRAGRLREQMLDACQGRITITLDLGGTDAD